MTHSASVGRSERADGKVKALPRTVPVSFVFIIHQWLVIQATSPKHATTARKNLGSLRGNILWNEFLYDDRRGIKESEQ